MLPPRILRRLLLVPLVIVIAGALVALAPALAALSVVFAIVRRRFGRMRALRIVYIALIWSLGEAAALAGFLCLWIISGGGGRLETEPYRTRHYGVMRWFLDLIYDAAQRACGLRVEVECPAADEMDSPGAPASAGAVEPEARPVIVLSRHAGPGDSLLLVRYLLAVCGRRPRVVMKATLQLDPSLDIVANRVPNAFLRLRSPAPAGSGPIAGRPQADQIRQVRRL